MIASSSAKPIAESEPVPLGAEGDAPSRTATTNAITRTAEAATMANASTPSMIRAESWTPRTISSSATTPTIPASTALVGAPADNPTRSSNDAR